jgi:hypothetical protein
MEAAGSGLSAKPLNAKIGQVLTALVAIGQCYIFSFFRFFHRRLVGVKAPNLHRGVTYF